MATALRETQLGLPGFREEKTGLTIEVRQFANGRPVFVSDREVRINQEGGLKGERVVSTDPVKRNLRKGLPARFRALNNAEAFLISNGSDSSIREGDFFTAYPGYGRKIKIGY